MIGELLLLFQRSSRGSYNERSGTRDSHRDRSLRGDRGRGNGNGYENERRQQRDYGRFVTYSVICLESEDFCCFFL